MKQEKLTPSQYRNCSSDVNMEYLNSNDVVSLSSGVNQSLMCKGNEIYHKFMFKNDNRENL